MPRQSEGAPPRPALFNLIDLLSNPPAHAAASINAKIAGPPELITIPKGQGLGNLPDILQQNWGIK